MMRLRDHTGQETRLKMCLGYIMMRLHYLTGENIRFKMHLGCIRMVLQYLTCKKSIKDSFRVTGPEYRCI